MKIFGREPALWLSLCSCLVMFLSAFLVPLTIEQQGMINAVCVAVFGLITAWVVASDGLSAAILGLLKAILALSVAFGLGLAPDKQSLIMTLASAIVAMFVRTQVTAPVTSAEVKAA